MHLLVYHTAWNMPEYRLEETHILACFTLSARKLAISYSFSDCLASDIPYYVLSISILYCMDYSLPYRELLLHHDLHACKLFVICITHELFFNMTYTLHGTLLSICLFFLAIWGSVTYSQHTQIRCHNAKW